MGPKVRVQSPNWWFRKVAPCQTHPFGPSLIQGNNLIKVSLYRVTIVVEDIHGLHPIIRASLSLLWNSGPELRVSMPPTTLVTL